MKNLFTVLLSSFILSSCSTMYIPNGVHTPLLKDQGDFSASASTGINVVDAHVAFSPIKNFGIMSTSSYNRYNRKYTPDSTIKEFRLNMDIAFGFYKHFSDEFVFEVYAGYGFGNFKTNNSFNTFEGSITGFYNRYFIQPAIGYHAEAAKVSFGLRFSQLMHTKTLDENNVNVFKGNIMFAEPNVNVAVGIEKVKLLFQAGFIIPMSQSVPNYGFVPLIIQTGLQFDFQNLFKKSNSESAP